ncbi:hypothetical protein [Halorubrum sp. Eb13]|uniref:hypothetical protein n=1 Tax=Halorubrum sp. Eb13 TaxID=1383843 RepID=UPI000B994F1B|nr:hypothetical protein [Halorubrum sp. Eb13]OYR44023.1 hypothetical protein DJ75_10070 [Halorubrum sp. Eb13]
MSLNSIVEMVVTHEPVTPDVFLLSTICVICENLDNIGHSNDILYGLPRVRSNGYVDDEMKESRLQELKDQLVGANEDTTELQAEIEELEQRITELTSFGSRTSFHTRSTGG